MAAFHLIVYSLIAVVALTWGGNHLCRLILLFTGLTGAVSPDPNEPAKAGRIIGSLERLIIALGLVAGSWEVIAAVVALKTVARFQELDSKTFAEYFLIGSLFSLFWASLVTGGWIAYDELIGVQARDEMAAVLSPLDAGAARSASDHR